MAARRYLAHSTPEGRSLFDRIAPTGYLPHNSDWVLSENLGFRTSLLATPVAIAEGWMASPAHRDNLLDPAVRDVGIAVARGAVKDRGTKGVILRRRLRDARRRPAGATSTPRRQVEGALTDREDQSRAWRRCRPLTSSTIRSPGSEVEDDSLTGADIDESTLSPPTPPGPTYVRREVVQQINGRNTTVDVPRQPGEFGISGGGAVIPVGEDQERRVGSPAIAAYASFPLANGTTWRFGVSNSLSMPSNFEVHAYAVGAD